MEKYKFASISLTVQNRVISLKFSTHRVSKKCTLGNFQKIFLFPKMAAILNFRIFTKNRKTEICFYLLQDRVISSKFSTQPMQKGMKLKIIYMYTNKYLSIIDIYFLQMKTGSCKTTVQFWQKVYGVDITHDNVCSSVLSCFYSYVAATTNRASYF